MPRGVSCLDCAGRHVQSAAADPAFSGTLQGTARELFAHSAWSIFVLKMLQEASKARLRRDAPPPVPPQFTCGVKLRLQA